MASDCTTVRRKLVKHGAVNLATGTYEARGATWETEPCGAPLFSDTDRKAGVCRSCASGWTHPDNFPASIAIEFEAAGFTLHATGGGCTAWRREIGNGWHILATDSEGTSHMVDAGERWLIGAHSNETADTHETTMDAATVAEAIEAANELAKVLA